KPALPKPIPQNRYRHRTGTVVFGDKVAPAKRTDPKRLEKIRRNYLPLEPYRLARAAKIETLPAALCCHGFEQCALAAPIRKVEIRSILQPPARVPFLKYYQPFRIFVGKRAKQSRVDDAENGRVGPDAQREREDGHGGEAGVLQQLAECEF